MKATNINRTEIKEYIRGKKCNKCEQKFTDEELKNNNYSLWFENDDDIKFTETMSGYRLQINVTRITHEWDERYASIYDCPDVEKCHDCYGKFKSADSKKGILDDDYYYCLPCFNKKYGDYLAKRAEKKEITSEQKEVMQVVQKALAEHLSSNYHQGGIDYRDCKVIDCEGYKETLKSYGLEQ